MVSFLRKSTAGLGALLVTLLVASCGGDGGDPPPTEPPTTGTLTVTVTADGSPRQNVTVHQFAPGASTVTASRSTDSNGVATFLSVEEGTWEVEIDVPGGFDLADGEDERKSVSVTAGATAGTSFSLVDNFTGETIEARDDPVFSQPNLVITAGTAVRWVNVGQMLHTVTPDGHTEWSSANLGSNGSAFTHTFDTPGTYDYYCEPHVGQGMTGTVTVN